jgi:hypothetical protein
MTTVMDPTFFTLAQAGEFCGGRKTRWARRHLLGTIPHFHPPGSGVLFRREDVVNWLEQHRREPTNVDAVVAKIFGPVAVRKKR